MNIVNLEVARLWRMIADEATTIQDAEWLRTQAREHRNTVIARRAYEEAWLGGTERAVRALGYSHEWTAHLINLHLEANPDAPPPAGWVRWLPEDADDLTELALPAW